MIETIDLDPYSGCGLVRVVLASDRIREDVFLLLDTGAAHTSVDRSVAARLGIVLPLRSQGSLDRVGGQADFWIANTTVTLLNATFPDFPLKFTDFGTHYLGRPSRRPGFQGLLGNDLLRAADLRAVVDVPKGRAVLATHNLR